MFLDNLKFKILPIFDKTANGVRLSLLIFLGIIIGAVLSSIFWRTKIGRLLKYKDFQINQLQEAGESLRQEKFEIASRVPSTPVPMIPYVKVESDDVYKIKCFDMEKEKLQLDWTKKLGEKLKEGEKIVNLCVNELLSQVVLISARNLKDTEISLHTDQEQNVQIYDWKTNELKLLQKEYGGVYYNCFQITTWSKTGNIYYLCGGGDGPVGYRTTKRVNIDTLEVGIAENCEYFDDGSGSNKFCTHYCKLNKDCGNRQFCDLTSLSCVQSCDEETGCDFGDCQPFGPVMGCGQ